jgi:hypothetical protein
MTSVLYRALYFLETWPRSIDPGEPLARVAASHAPVNTSTIDVATRPNLTQQPTIFRSALGGAKNRGTELGMSPKFEGCSTRAQSGVCSYCADRGGDWH